SLHDALPICRTAIGNQRQGHANNWEQAHHHPGVDKEIKEKASDDPETQQAAEVIAASERDRKPVDDDQGIESKQPEPADEAKLLGQGRKDEVGLLLRQKAQMALAALQETLAEQSAGTERD